MKPIIDMGLMAFKPTFSEGRATALKNIEIVYQHMNQSDQRRIAKMKQLDEHFRPYLKN